MHRLPLAKRQLLLHVVKTVVKTLLPAAASLSSEPGPATEEMGDFSVTFLASRVVTRLNDPIWPPCFGESRACDGPQVKVWHVDFRTGSCPDTSAPCSFWLFVGKESNDQVAKGVNVSSAFSLIFGETGLFAPHIPLQVY